MVMPGGTTGLDLLARFRRERADLRAIISSGYGGALSGSTPPMAPGLITEIRTRIVLFLGHHWLD